MAAKKSQVVESMRAAASLLGCGLEVVKRAKEKGCPAFKTGNRIHTGELEKWIAENSDQMKVEILDLKDQKTNEEIRKLKIGNDLKERILVRKSDGAALIESLGREIDEMLMQKLENEYPASVSGMDVPQARVYGKRLGDQIRGAFRKFADGWRKL